MAKKEQLPDNHDDTESIAPRSAGREEDLGSIGRSILAQVRGLVEGEQGVFGGEENAFESLFLRREKHTCPLKSRTRWPRWTRLFGPSSKA
ncbi:MAG: hypothetical protein Q8O76_07675 [Chloroflexota bacterium]|nr:hypothetical protein [Chloroflexota bacterium]